MKQYYTVIDEEAAILVWNPDVIPLLSNYYVRLDGTNGGYLTGYFYAPNVQMIFVPYIVVKLISAGY